MRKIGVAILGLGVVGGGTYRVLTQHRAFYQRTQNLDITVESVLETNPERIRTLGIPEEIVAANVAEAVLNPDVNVVVECIGGTEPRGSSCLRRFMRARRSSHPTKNSSVSILTNWNLRPKRTTPACISRQAAWEAFRSSERFLTACRRTKFPVSWGSSTAPQISSSPK